MLKGYIGGVKVDKSIKPIPMKNRIVPTLVIGGDYYVSFGGNNTYPCKLIKVLDEMAEPDVNIEIPIKSTSKKGFKDSKGNISQFSVSSHILNATEIGSTREEAVRNSMLG